MTEKRFSHKKWYDERQLFDNGEPFAIVDVYIQTDEICNKLNELSDENESLKQYKTAVNDVLDSYYQRDLSPSEEMLIGAIAKELNIDLHYKYKR